VIQITWPDGELSSLTGSQLRQFCACSKCRARNIVGQQLINESGNISAFHLMGSTGMQVIFEDGHDRGIFPWAYLKAISENKALDYLNS